MREIDPSHIISRAPDLILRPIPEWGCLFVYTPARPDIHCLDARSWLLFELCDGRPFTEVVKEFAEAVPEGTSDDVVRASATEAVSVLIDKSLVREVELA